jgi:hypothetical protein
MIGCSVTGEGAAAAAGLATVRGGSARSAVIVGCRGRVTATGFQPVDIGSDAGGTAAGGIGVAADWRSTDLLQLGDYRIWIDSRGRMRLKHGAPRSDDDGRPVGSSV